MSLKQLEDLSLSSAELPGFTRVESSEACTDCCCDLACDTYD